MDFIETEVFKILGWNNPVQDKVQWRVYVMKHYC
jgi:hypothetical protein